MIDFKGHLLHNSMTVLSFCCPFKIMNCFQLGHTNDALIFPVSERPYFSDQDPV